MAFSEDMYEEAPEFPERLEQVLVYAVNEARNTMMENGGFVPFVAVLVSEEDVMI